MNSALRPPEPGPARPTSFGRWLERASKRTLSRWLARAAPARPIDAADLVAAPVERLLVVRQHNQMGDMVCALPALRALRRAYPRARLTFVASPLCEELLRDHPDIDALVVFDKWAMWRPWRLAALLRRLRRPRPDLAFVMTTVSFSTTSALLAWASGARLRVGASSLPFGWHLSRAVYNLELPLGPPGLHEVEHNLAPLRAVGIPAPLESPSLVPSPAAVQRARAFVESSFGSEAAGPLVAVHAGAGKAANLWPADGFGTVLQTLRRERQARVLLIEGPGDAATIGALAARLGGAPRWRAALGETLGLLALADLVLCNDTGIAHVAAAVGAPTLVLFGPTDPQRWRPLGEQVRVLRSPTGRIADLDAETVLRAALEATAHSFHPGTPLHGTKFSTATRRDRTGATRPSAP